MDDLRAPTLYNELRRISQEAKFLEVTLDKCKGSRYSMSLRAQTPYMYILYKGAHRAQPHGKLGLYSAGPTGSSAPLYRVYM